MARRGSRLAVVELSALGCIACASGPAQRAELGAYRDLRGALVSAETTFTGMRGRYAAYRVRLASSTGVVATGRLLRPARGEGPFPAVLLNNGRELNSRALEYLPEDFGEVVALSLDYPEELPYEVSVRDLFFRTATLKRAAQRIPVLFSLGGAYLAGRSDVDSARLGLAATSFAVPFAVIAAALDERFANVALIYGAANFSTILAANLDVPRGLRRPLAWLATRPLVDLEPTRFIARIAPRPLVMVNGADDPQMPRSAVQALYDAAREPKALIWLRTGHLMPTDSALIRALVDTTLARMPVLRGTPDRTPDSTLHAPRSTLNARHSTLSPDLPAARPPPPAERAIAPSPPATGARPR